MAKAREVAGGWISEREAWSDVHRLAQRIIDDVGVVSRPEVIKDMARRIRRNAELALIQLDAGLHRNPALVVYGNPPRGGECMSRRVYAVEYKHAADGEDYRHDCSAGVSMYGLSDGGILLQRPDRKPLSKEF